MVFMSLTFGLLFAGRVREVSADVQDEYPTCEKFSITPLDATSMYENVFLSYCKIKDLTCVVGVFNRTLSCVKIKGGLFE